MSYDVLTLFSISGMIDTSRLETLTLILLNALGLNRDLGC